LEVGLHGAYAKPSQALADAEPGDTIHIGDGEYYDCLIIRTPNLTIAGTARQTLLTDTTCQGKAIVLVDAPGLLVRDIMLGRARVPDGNGAAIRSEGFGVTLDAVRIINNQAGLLAEAGGGTVVVRNSEFVGNGSCNGTSCRGAIVVDNAARLEISRSAVVDTKGGHAVQSAATDTVIAHARLADGENGTSGYLLQVSGNLDLRDSDLQKGMLTGNLDAAIHAQAPLGQPRHLLLATNHYTDDTQRNSAFLRNWTSSEAQMQGNTLIGTDVLQTSSGKNLHRLYSTALDSKAWLRHLVGSAYHFVAKSLHATNGQ
jgi:hypothetical protein